MEVSWANGPRRLRSCCACKSSSHIILLSLGSVPVQIPGTFPVHIPLNQGGLQGPYFVRLTRHIG